MKLVVIGGVAGGPSATAKAKRVNPDLEVVAFEKGGFISYAACGLPYVVSGDIPSLDALVARTPKQFADQGITIKPRHEVLNVDYANRQVRVFNHLGHTEFTESFDRLLIATGATPTHPNLPGLALGNIFTLRSMEDGRAILEAVNALPSGARAVVVGGGYIGLEMAEAFVKRGLRVTVVEQLPRLLGNVDREIADIAKNELERHGVEVLLESRVTGFSGDGRVEKVLTTHGELEASLVLLALGVHPNSKLAASFGVDTLPTGAIAVNDRLETNLEGVYAVGDVVEVHHLVSGRHAYIPLGDTANKQGRVAGVNIGGGSAHFPGVVGTAVSKVFDLGFAVTGLTELDAVYMGLEARSTLIQAPDVASYYPGATPLSVKLVYEPSSGRLLGAQMAGRVGAVKRIDVIAALLHRRGTLEELSDLDLAYAPPFSAVWDPLLIAANQALSS
jgi:NADPH-dependent 2,4-dienoyl-CoA reductase/sulfur reductase-like enzyme